jgi:anti-anti-sigma regulatory factor
MISRFGAAAVELGGRRLTVAAHPTIATLRPLPKSEAGAGTEGVREGVEMATAAPQPGASFNLVTTAPHEGLLLVDVEGEPDASARSRWAGIFNHAITDGATGIAVDLRGCPAVDYACLSVLLATSVALKARGGGGISLVITPGSPLERTVRASVVDELPAYSSASDALRSLHDAE